MCSTESDFSIVDTFPFVHVSCLHVYKGVRSCPTKTYYTLTNGKINSNQLYLLLGPAAGRLCQHNCEQVCENQLCQHTKITTFFQLC